MMEQIIEKAPGGAVGQVVIKDTTTANFKADVIDASMEAPIIVDFWAPWCSPCKQLTPILEKIVTEAGGKVQLVKLNIDEAQQIAAQMQIQSIPAVYAFFQGRPVDGFMGAVPESQVRQFVDQLAAVADKAAGPSPIDEALEQAKAALESGDASAAGAIYGQVLQQDQANVKAMAGMGRCYLQPDKPRRLKEFWTQFPKTKTTTRMSPHSGTLAAQVIRLPAKQRRSKKRSRQTHKTIKFASTLPLPITVTAQTSKRSMPCLIFYAQTLVGMREPPASNWSRYLRHWVTLIRTQWKVGRRWRPFSLPSVSRYGRDRPTGLNPCLPLSGVLLLPRGRIPLNVFEPRYRNMMQDALSGDGIIGMVQPVSPEEVPVTPEGQIKNLDGERLALYSTGCAGRIVSHEESPDGRFLIVLEGLNRFKIGEEIETTRGYRRFRSDWSAYPADQSEGRETLMDRAKLLAAMEKYLPAKTFARTGPQLTMRTMIAW